MLISYKCGDEVFICEEKDERGMVYDYFEVGGRDIDIYNRETYTSVIQIQYKIGVGGD